MPLIEYVALVRRRTLARREPPDKCNGPIIVSGQAHMCNAQPCPAVVYVADVLLPSTLINQLYGAHKCQALPIPHNHQTDN